MKTIKSTKRIAANLLSVSKKDIETAFTKYNQEVLDNPGAFSKPSKDAAKDAKNQAKHVWKLLKG